MSGVGTPAGDASAGATPEPAAYRAALAAAAFVVRGEVRRLKVTGRAPRRMLQGMVSGRLPAPLVEDAPGRWRGRAEPSALLDVRGRMIGWMRISPLPAEPATPSAEGRPVSEEAGDLLIEVPDAALPGTLEHFRKYLPPRFATLTDLTASTALVSLLGPAGPELLSRTVIGAATGDELAGLAEGGLFVLERSGRPPLTVVRTAEVATPAWDLVTGSEDASTLTAALAEGGAREAETRTWDVLRLEAGRPAYGADMDAGTIPVEAGVHDRAVDYGKGCFTGQEVLIRIRDRGHVNRHLRGLRLGSPEALPVSGTELFGDDGKALGRVTSTARSPRFGEVIGLGYVRREVHPPAVLHLGAASGPPVSVRDLGSDWSP